MDGELSSIPATRQSGLHLSFDGHSQRTMQRWLDCSEQSNSIRFSSARNAPAEMPRSPTS